MQIDALGGIFFAESALLSILYCFPECLSMLFHHNGRKCLAGRADKALPHTERLVFVPDQRYNQDSSQQ